VASQGTTMWCVRACDAVSQKYLQEETGCGQADFSIMPGTCKLHGPASDCALAFLLCHLQEAKHGCTQTRVRKFERKTISRRASGSASAGSRPSGPACSLAPRPRACHPHRPLPVCPSPTRSQSLSLFHLQHPQIFKQATTLNVKMIWRSRLRQRSAGDVMDKQRQCQRPAGDANSECSNVLALTSASKLSW